jgi:NAD(P)-dependent dehydrogenase (short-subunit alcohol dehydrogenase family)
MVYETAVIWHHRPMKPIIPCIVIVALLLQSAHGQTPDEQPATETINRRPVVLITGSNRGIGLEFVRQFSARDWHIIATTRSPDYATDLQALAAADSDIVIEQLDVTDHPRVDALAEQYRTQPIDILLLNAAMGPTPETAMLPLAKLDWDVGRQSFEVNTIGPMKVSQAFMEHVKASQKKQIIAISSDSGSFVAGSQAPILYHYKMSKAALNMYLHTLAFESKKRGVTVIMLHPGLVGTNPQLAKFPGAIKTEDSVRQMLEVIDGLTPADNGRFISYQGETMPW